MPSPISVNIGHVASKTAPQAAGNTQSTAAQQAQVPTANQVATASQVAAEQSAVRVQIAKEKSIQIPKRVEGAFDSEEEQEKEEISDDAEKLEADRSISHRTKVNLKA